MSTKLAVGIGMMLGSIIGGYAPALFGVDLFSFTAIITSTIGSLIGIFVGYKLSNE